jgi:aspartate racemase
MKGESGRTIGLIGGLGPRATIHYYERLTKAFAERGVLLRLSISHADLSHVLGRVQAGALAQRLVRDQGADAVILAGTELSLAFDETTCGFPALDCARAHLDAIIARALADRPTS